jgi:hypothetical protein
MPDEFFETVAHHLPPEMPVGPKGGRQRRSPGRRPGHLVRAHHGGPLGGFPGRTRLFRPAHRRLRVWEEARIWDRLHADLLAALKRARTLDPDVVLIDG